MPRLQQITADQLREHLVDVEGKRPTLRLVVGINYKEGVNQSELADWYAISRTTVHNWLSRLERLEDEPIENVLYDANRPGRPAKLSPQELDELVSILEESPPEAGIDAPHWTPKFAQILINEKFDVEYSLRHVRELLNQAGFNWKTARLEFAAGKEHARVAFTRGKN